MNEISSIVIHGEQTENKRQPSSSKNVASSSHSTEGSDIEAVKPNEAAGFGNLLVPNLTSTRDRIEDKLRYYKTERNAVQFFSDTNTKAVNEISSIVIHGEQTENKRQPRSFKNEARSSHSTEGNDIEAVKPNEGAQFGNLFDPNLISFARDRIEDKLRYYKKERNSVQFLSDTNWNKSSWTVEPEIVSIGPVHSKKADRLLQFEKYKWFFLEKFLRRGEKGYRKVDYLLVELQSSEARTRDFYSDHKQISEMPSEDLIEMMLLDGSFLIELLCYLSRDEIPKVDDDPILVKPFLIPIIARDVLKLENQLPLFVLTSLFHQSDDKFMKLALDFFNLSWTGPKMTLPSELPNCSHLLDLFYWSSVKPLRVNHGDDQTYASTHSMECVTELKLSGIKFLQRKTAETFLDIKFKNRLLQIPAITFSSMMQTVLVNCVALEESRDCHIKYFCNYVSFFYCLISQPRDVSALSSDGIISKFSGDDRYVADFIRDLGRNIECVRHSYLSDEIKNIEAYYNGDQASLRRNYFANKWTALKVFAASLLLVLAIIQTLMSVLSYFRGSKYGGN